MLRRTIGVREAKTQLSRVLRDVGQGNEWIITDRGEPVARIAPLPSAILPLEDRIRQLEDRGWIEPRRRPYSPLPSPLPVPAGLAQQWLQEARDK